MEGIKELVFVKPKDKIRSAVEIMNKTGFSQLPVFENNNPIGSIYENRILSEVIDNPQIMENNIESIMAENFATVKKESKIDELKELLKISSAVLVSDHDLATEGLDSLIY